MAMASSDPSFLPQDFFPPSKINIKRNLKSPVIKDDGH